MAHMTNVRGNLLCQVFIQGKCYIYIYSKQVNSEKTELRLWLRLIQALLTNLKCHECSFLATPMRKFILLYCDSVCY